MATTPDVDLSDSSIKEMRGKLGELAQMCLRKSRVAVFVIRDDGIMTIVPSSILSSVPPEDMAGHLLDSWNEEQITEFLIHLEQLGTRT